MPREQHRSGARACEPARSGAECWDRAVELGEQHGYRNAQATVLAPTGTIGLLMDCDTTGVEPDFALDQVQEAGGRRQLQDRQPVRPRALKKLGYTAAQVQAIVDYVRGTATLESVPEFAARRAGGAGPVGGGDRPGGEVARVGVRPALGVRLARDGRRGPAAAGSRCFRQGQARAGEARVQRRADRQGDVDRLRPADRRGRAVPQAGALSGLRLRQPLRPARARASSSRWATCG